MNQGKNGHGSNTRILFHLSMYVNSPCYNYQGLLILVYLFVIFFTLSEQNYYSIYLNVLPNSLLTLKPMTWILQPDCIGFSRLKQRSDSEAVLCAFSKAYPSPTFNENTWQTFVKPGTSYLTDPS
jgi:hypothetical protein